MDYDKEISEMLEELALLGEDRSKGSFNKVLDSIIELRTDLIKNYEKLEESQIKKYGFILDQVEKLYQNIDYKIKNSFKLPTLGTW